MNIFDRIAEWWRDPSSLAARGVDLDERDGAERGQQYRRAA
jgi:hypothetical protein